jgi:hypothetical protein
VGVVAAAVAVLTYLSMAAAVALAATLFSRALLLEQTRVLLSAIRLPLVLLVEQTHLALPQVPDKVTKLLQ